MKILAGDWRKRKWLEAQAVWTAKMAAEGKLPRTRRDVYAEIAEIAREEQEQEALRLSQIHISGINLDERTENDAESPEEAPSPDELGVATTLSSKRPSSQYDQSETGEQKNNNEPEVFLFDTKYTNGFKDCRQHSDPNQVFDCFGDPIAEDDFLGEGPITPGGRGSSYLCEGLPISRLPCRISAAYTRMSVKRPIVCDGSCTTLAPSYSAHLAHTDDVDFNHVDFSYGSLDVVINIFSIGTFLFDVGSDLWLVFIYAHMGHWWWFGLTLSCIVASSVVSTFFSLVWYIQDHRFESTHQMTTASVLRWFVRISFMFFQMSPILRWVYYWV